MRIAQLDILRALAVLLVMVRHLHRPPAEFPNSVENAIRAAKALGWVGVDLFFVLSGFLIGGLLFKELQQRGRLRIGRFLIRRGFKLYPAFYVLLLVTLIGYAAFPRVGWMVSPAEQPRAAIDLAPDPKTLTDEQALAIARDRNTDIYRWNALKRHENTGLAPSAPTLQETSELEVFSLKRQVWPEAVFMQSYFDGLWVHTWSLAIEEHFYLMLPFVLTAIWRFVPDQRRRTMCMLALVALVMLGCWAWRVYAVGGLHLGKPGPGFNFHEFRTRVFYSHARLDALLFGVLLAYGSAYHRPRIDALVGRGWFKFALAALLLVALGPCLKIPLNDGYWPIVGFPLITVAFGALVLWFVRQPLPAWRPIAFACKWLAAFGAFSYSVYLFHVPVRDWGPALFELATGITPSWAGAMVGYLLVSVVLGIGVAKLVEIPALRVRDRLFPWQVEQKAKA
jgi:peptidoglycan/LPS O-acetylase OafA/YrhL